MIACHFRFIDHLGKPTGYHGVAWAKDEIGLFWAIDAHGNPYRCQVADVKLTGSFCVLEVDHGDDDVEYQEHEIYIDDQGLKWTKPKWPKNIYV